MRNLIPLITLAFLLSCNGGGGGSSGPRAVLNPDLENSIWKTSYVNGTAFLEDRMTITGSAMVLETYCMSCGGNLMQTLNWTVTPIDSDTAQVDDGSTTFRFDYEINGNTLEVYFDDGDHNTYTR